MARHSTPVGYDKKFAALIALIDDAKHQGVDAVVIDQPWVLGDDYDELIQSLSRLADAELALRIVRPVG